MKLRCTQDSIRLRVRKSDLNDLKKFGEISGALHFGVGKQLRYALTTDQVPHPQASYENDQITIALPLTSALAWMESEQVSLEYRQAFDEGSSLHLLIEKDFPCRHTEEHNLKDTFFELVPQDDDPG